MSQLAARTNNHICSKVLSRYYLLVVYFSSAKRVSKPAVVSPQLDCRTQDLSILKIAQSQSQLFPQQRRDRFQTKGILPNGCVLSKSSYFQTVVGPSIAMLYILLW